MELVERHDRRSRVGAAAAEAGRDRDPLLDRDASGDVRPARRLGPGLRRPVHERLSTRIGELVGPRTDHEHLEAVGVLDRHDVVQIHGQEHGLDVVVAVVASAEHPQEHVELRVGVPRDHWCTASVTRAKAVRSSVSGRAVGSTPEAASAASAARRLEARAGAARFASFCVAPRRRCRRRSRAQPRRRRQVAAVGDRVARRQTPPLGAARTPRAAPCERPPPVARYATRSSPRRRPRAGRRRPTDRRPRVAASPRCASPTARARARRARSRCRRCTGGSRSTPSCHRRASLPSPASWHRRGGSRRSDDHPPLGEPGNNARSNSTASTRSAPRRRARS